MEETWRWFGPEDPISLLKVRQTGATGVVTSLHHVAVGAAWSREEVLRRRALIEAAGLRWSVVESLPVHSAIRLQEPDCERYLEAYRSSLAELGAAGVRTVCYNFMPVIDWTRTSLTHRAPDGSVALRFDTTDWAAFDVFLLRRKGAQQDYMESQLEAAERRVQQLSAAQRQALIETVAAGLPGANEDGHSLEGLRGALERWSEVTDAELRGRLVAFLDSIRDECERHGMLMCLHPDDPPRRLLGLPRIASCAADFETLFAEVPAAFNGMTLCVGSLGAGACNDPVAMAERFAERIYFAHLRAVHLEPDGSFVEAEHLAGDTNLIAVMRALVAEERRRGATDHPQPSIPMRPDHGRLLDGDIGDHPGYPWVGRLKALAELRGALRAIEVLGG